MSLKWKKLREAKASLGELYLATDHEKGVIYTYEKDIICATCVVCGGVSGPYDPAMSMTPLKHGRERIQHTINCALLKAVDRAVSNA